MPVTKQHVDLSVLVEVIGPRPEPIIADAGRVLDVLSARWY
jgi:hypothetical protein